MTSNFDSGPTASLRTLQARARLLAALRSFFSSQGYWEVETPLLSHDCCIDAWIDPWVVPVSGQQRVFLQTSPEFAMKRLLCAGADRIFQVTKSFRREESGPLHNPEFTIAEWYAREADHFAQMHFVQSLVMQLGQVCLEIAGEPRHPLGNGPIPQLSYEQAFQESVGLSPWDASFAQLVSAARAAGAALPRDAAADRDDILNLLWAQRVEPRLRDFPAVFIHGYPASQAALARIDPGPPPVAERFELYLDGIEICNGYHELTDAAELRQRMVRQSEKRAAAGKERLPVDSRLLSAMEGGFSDCSGVALGFDRLVLWRLGLDALNDVIPFPFDRA